MRINADEFVQMKARFENYLAGKKLWDEADRQKTEETAKRRIEEGVKIAESFSAPPEKMFDFIFEKPPWHLIEQKDAFLEGRP